MEKLKEMLSAPRVRELGHALKNAHPPFALESFLRSLEKELPKLELKDRVRLISAALREHLPQELNQAYAVILGAIQSEPNPRGVTGFLAWPLTQFVEDFGLAAPDLSLATLKELTRVMSAEFAVRPFLLQHPQKTLKLFREWAQHENVHVRRLVSEGTRPRLPWGQRLPLFQADPQHCIRLLRQLRHDPELYVRKSVANHLNDFSKDHGDWLVEELNEWQTECPLDENVRWIIRHATRSLVKQGHRGALQLQGFAPARAKNPRLRVTPKSLRLGKKLEMHFRAQSTRKEAWLIDYAVHHRKSNGQLSQKVFKWTRLNASAGQQISLTKTHPFLPISTRRYFSGRHEIEVLLNGRSVAKTSFHLTV